MKGGGKLTLKNIAELAGTSVSTVSRVLSDNPRISDKTKAKVMAIVRENDFQLNAMARALAGGRTGMIGVLASNIGSGFFAEVIHGIDSMARFKDAHLMCSFASSADDYYSMLRKIDALGQVDGIILVAPPIEIFDKPRIVDLPFVYCAASPGDIRSSWSDADWILFENRNCMKKIISHLVSQGCQNIVHFAGPSHNYDAILRRDGFVRAVSQHPDATGKVVQVSYEQDSIFKEARKVLSADGPKPDAIVAWNDTTAICVLEVMKNMFGGSDIPIAVTGWDDEPIAGILGLTTVRMPVREMGEHAATLLFERTAGTPRTTPTNETFDLNLIVRDSSVRT